MKTLKQVKDALNKLPDELLDKYFITHCMGLEDPEAQIGLVWFDDEENEDKLRGMQEMDGFDVIQQFARDIDTDATKVAIAKLDPSKEEDYCDDIAEKD